MRDGASVAVPLDPAMLPKWSPATIHIVFGNKEIDQTIQGIKEHYYNIVITIMLWTWREEQQQGRFDESFPTGHTITQVFNFYGGKDVVKGIISLLESIR